MKSFEFGASLEWVLQIHSSFPKKIEKTQKNENVWVWIKFGESLENLQTHSKLTKKSLLDVMFQKACFFSKKRKSEFGESPNSLQTQKNICVHNLFLSGARIFFLKKKCARIFFEFGESLEILQTLFFFQKSFQFWQLHQATLCEFGDSPNSLQTHSKLAPNSYAFIFSVLFSILLLCFWKEEWVWTKFAPNSYVFMFFYFFWKRWMSLEWGWRFSKLAPNSQTRSKLKGVFATSFVWGKRGMSLEWVWRFSKLSPNSLQTQMISFVQCVFPLLFSSFLFGKDERLWSEFGVNLVHAYHPAKLVQVITMAWQQKTECCMGKWSINMNIVCINTILNLSNYQYVSINIAFNILYWHLSIWFWKQCILKTW